MKVLKKGIWQISDASIGLGAGLFSFALIVVPLMSAFHQDQQYSTAARHALRVEKATHQYLQHNALIIGKQASATSPYILDVPKLIQAGYLPTGFSETNPFSSRYHTRIYQPAPLKFHHMIFLTGGAPLNLSAARKIALRIGDSGGYIEGAIAKGVMGGWRESLSAFGGYNPGEGQVVITGFFSQGKGKKDYLYRHAIPGQGELNTMNTAINMDGNDINDVNQLHAHTLKTQSVHATGNAEIEGDIRFVGNISTSKNIFSQGHMTTNGWFISKGKTGWYSEQGEGGWHMTDKMWIKAYNGKSIYTRGTVRGGYVQIDNISVVNTPCPSNGLLSRDASGATLSCQSGIWKSSEKLSAKNCHWRGLPGQGNGGEGLKRTSCPIGFYVAGLQNWREGDWTRTGHFAVECCQ